MKKPSKYRAIPTVVDGVRFASKKEARRYGELKLLERAKKITGLILQPRFPCIVGEQLICTYVGDFSYLEPHSTSGILCVVVEDVKGMQTPLFKLKWKLVQALYGFTWRLI